MLDLAEVVKYEWHSRGRYTLQMGRVLQRGDCGSSFRELTCTAGKGANLIPMQSSIIGLLLHLRYTVQFLHSCMRTCRLDTASTHPSTPVICAGPSTVPQISRLSVTPLIVRLAKGKALAVETERSIMQWWRLTREAGALALRA